jgi:hypothetical protein
MKQKKDMLKGEYNLFIAAGIIIIVFVSGFLAIKYFPKPTKVIAPVIQNQTNYNGYNFTKVDGIWYTNVNVEWSGRMFSYDLPIYFSPHEVENVSIDKDVGVILKLGTKPTAYISVDPSLDSNAVVGGTEISKVLGKMFFMTVKAATTREISIGYPVITCMNVSEKTRVIIIQPGNVTRIYRDEAGCVTIEGPNGLEIIRAADRLVYNLLGIDKTG